MAVVPFPIVCDGSRAAHIFEVRLAETSEERSRSPCPRAVDRLADGPEFAARMKEVQQRFRESVIITFRGAEMNDLSDAGLGLLKRTISEKTNAN